MVEHLFNKNGVGRTQSLCSNRSEFWSFHNKVYSYMEDRVNNNFGVHGFQKSVSVLITMYVDGVNSIREKVRRKCYTIN